MGIEGTEQNFEYGNVTIGDLTTPYSSNKKGNVISLEVGEHIPEEFLEIFIDNLCGLCNGKLILSWAVPGQDGIGHVSCRHNIWVIDQIEKRGFKLNVSDTLTVRTVVEDRVSYFRNTLMIFDKA
jgi:tryptophanyl-tRNA synthetase